MVDMLVMEMWKQFPEKLLVLLTLTSNPVFWPKEAGPEVESQMENILWPLQQKHVESGGKMRTEM